MKKFLALLVMIIMALPALAVDDHPRNPRRNRHYRPHPPGHSRPAPGRYYPRPGHRNPRVCQVVMIDRYNRVLRRYWGRGNGWGQCREGLRQCHWDLRRWGGWGARCAQVRY